MSGHSKWATIKRSKGKADAARGKLFNRIIREVTIAARIGGSDPESNPRLRSAISSARSANMPNKNVESAIQKGAGTLEGVNYEEIVFEGYGSGGVAVMIECMTDNRNRTVSEVRHVLTKYGGNLGTTNSVARMFKSTGLIRVAKDAMAEDQLMEVVLEAGAEDMEIDGEEFEILTPPDSFENVKSAIEKFNITPVSAELTKLPETTVPVQGENASRIMKMMEALDDLDDTQQVYANFDISEEDMEKMQ
ncbi:MAG: YebC/PmpR family DNA-binding transcriptional regulator [Chitinispirillaceae bacterium]|nr:YebC/PmpR family DNA-binding transcriptional regulator [Chitinispirillaceae bacterium]